MPFLVELAVSVHFNAYQELHCPEQILMLAVSSFLNNRSIHILFFYIDGQYSNSSVISL